MDKSDKELERAHLLDNVLKIIIENYPSNRASNPVYIRYHLQQNLGVQNFQLLEYLKEEWQVFEISKDYMQMGETEGEVTLTPQAMHRLRIEGPWYVKELEGNREIEKMGEEVDKIRQASFQQRIKTAEEKQRLKDERERSEKIWRWIFSGFGWFIAIIIAAWAAWGSDNSKTYEKKELRLETKIDTLQTQLDAVTKQLKAIPDSILVQYPVK